MALLAWVWSRMLHGPLAIFTGARLYRMVSQHPSMIFYVCLPRSNSTHPPWKLQAHRALLTSQVAVNSLEQMNAPQLHLRAWPASTRCWA